MLAFWQAIFYSKLAAPIFKWVANLMGVTPQVCKEYCTSGMIMYGFKWFLIILALCAAIWALCIYLTKKKNSTKKPEEVKPMATWAKVLLGVLSCLLVLGGTIGASTVQQLVTVKGLKNEGNSDKYNPENTAPLASQPIKGKKLFWLGSSVFQGFGAGGTSPALWVDAQEGTSSVIEIKGGTFLASVDGEIGSGLGSIDASTSYTNRLKNHDAKTDPGIDLVVVQLSTNDSKGFCPLGEVQPAGKKDFNDFDLTTTAGSLEAITAYARDVWGARTLVITGTEFVDEMTYSGGQHADIYLDMIDVCHQIDEKWGDQFEVLDLWHNEPMYEGITMGDTLWRSYMSDAIHPTKKGYLEWWGPYVNAAIEGMLK